MRGFVAGVALTSVLTVVGVLSVGPATGSQLVALATPARLAPLVAGPGQQGRWVPAGRPVAGHAAVYVTSLRLPADPQVSAGVAWLDPRLLRARLYSGSLSPGGFGWRYSAPITHGAARTLVAAFAGGFLLPASHGGYLSEGRLVAPLRVGAASLVIYADGSWAVGQWGRDLGMTPRVVAVRQNLTLLVDHARPVAGLSARDISVWGVALNGVANTWRSGFGVTASGGYVYVAGPMTVVELAQVLVRAGAVRAMVLDMNPLWPVFATYRPSSAGGFASPANGTDLLSTMLQSPARFFQPTYSRDFVTMSAR
ncbi:MAG: hypothetical protein ACYDEH_02250 [Acidimicrobiales bacterium]